MYFPRNREFGSALSKLRNFEGGGIEPPSTPPQYARMYKIIQQQLTDEWSFVFGCGNVKCGYYLLWIMNYIKEDSEGFWKYLEEVHTHQFNKLYHKTLI
jgi:hypothetical protein